MMADQQGVSGFEALLHLLSAKVPGQAHIIHDPACPAMPKSHNSKKHYPNDDLLAGCWPWWLLSLLANILLACIVHLQQGGNMWLILFSLAYICWQPTNVSVQLRD